MRIGELHTFQWNLPSHPAAGGGPLSGQVGQLEELEPDVPLYTNWTRAPYMVYCTISYYEWKSTCVGGAGDNGELNCRRNSAGEFTGHREWGWKRSSKTTGYTPDMALNDVPASMLADLNGDGLLMPIGVVCLSFAAWMITVMSIILNGHTRIAGVQCGIGPRGKHRAKSGGREFRCHKFTIKSGLD
jgi:hypothetical protein